MAVQLMGDLVEGTTTFEAVYPLGMATSIVRIRTPNGIVMAADGLDSYGKKTTQKLFDLTNDSGVCGVGISGVGGALFRNEGSGESLDINFSAECRSLCDRFRTRNPRHIKRLVSSFANTLATTINDKIAAGIKTGVVLEADRAQLWKDQGSKQGTTLHFAGYDGKDAYFATASIRFNGIDPHVAIDRITHFPSAESVSSIMYGSKAVEDLLRSVDSNEFDAFKTPGLRAIFDETADASDAVEAAQSYIAACSTPAAAILDSFCKTIGGHIHIATLTREEFKWHAPPLPAEQ
jgi:hypothetical protein